MSPGVMTVVINMCRHYGEVPLMDMEHNCLKTSLEDLGAATCELVNVVEHKVQSPLEVLQ